MKRRVPARATAPAATSSELSGPTETTDHPLLAGAPERYHEDRAAALPGEGLEGAVGEHPEVRVRRATVEGAAHRVLVHRSAAADLLVIGARRRHSRLGLQLGRVAHAALLHAVCSVAVVPQPA